MVHGETILKERLVDFESRQSVLEFYYQYRDFRAGPVSTETSGNFTFYRRIHEFLNPFHRKFCENATTE